MKVKSNIAVSETGFIFHPETGESFSVNPMGQEILNMLRENRSFDDIRDHLLDQYITDEDTVERDFHDFISQLEQFQILEEDGEA